MGNSKEQLKQAFKSGKYILKEDEYIGGDGLPYCKNCRTKRYYYYEEDDLCVRGMCECQTNARKHEEEERNRRKFMETFRNNKKLTMIGDRYANCMFESARITEHNKEAYEKCKRYVDNCADVYNENIGMYIYGDNSSGKTHLTACMCNELVYKGVRCVYTNLAMILNEIRSSYDGGGISENNLMRKLQSYEFAFIDDIGKEFIGRDYNGAMAKWAEQKLFEVINNRYNARKPTIFSSNYSIDDLGNIIKLDKAIIERIDEMSTRIIKLEGDDFRNTQRERKSELAKKLGI